MNAKINYQEFHKRRKNAGMTQQDVADLVGVTRGTVVGWDKNPGNIPIKHYAVIEQAFSSIESLQIELKKLNEES